LNNPVNAETTRLIPHPSQDHTLNKSAPGGIPTRRK
jgi:hypothetical protein